MAFMAVSSEGPAVIKTTGKADGSLVSEITPYYLYRFVDATDDKHNDKTIEFEDTINDGATGVERPKPVDIRTGSGANPSFEISPSNADFRADQLTSAHVVVFDPTTTGDDDIGELVIRTPDGDEVHEHIKLLGDGTPKIHLNVNTGGLEVYNINNNQITGAAFIGTVGLDWQFAGIAPIHAAGASDLVLRNVNTGQFEVYDIANNQIIGAASLGQVGLEWQLGGFAADPPTAPMGSSDGSTSQLVQAMAGFGGGSGAGESLNPLSAETSQQPLLTMPQHP